MEPKEAGKAWLCSCSSFPPHTFPETSQIPEQPGLWTQGTQGTKELSMICTWGLSRYSDWSDCRIDSTYSAAYLRIHIALDKNVQPGSTFLSMARSAFRVSPRSLEPQDNLLLICVSITSGFLHTLNKTQSSKQKLWRAKMVCLTSAVGCLQSNVSVEGRVSFLIASKEAISWSILVPWLM